MKKITALLLILLAPLLTIGWGKTGHRVVGKIAEMHVSKKALKSIDQVLQGESIAEVGNYMDFIRSDNQFDHMGPWHYCTVPDGKTYAEAGTPAEGDAVQTINRLVQELKTKQFTDGDEAFALKRLIHLVADIHQPLHVGNGNDKGGNDVKVNYFGMSTNLHAVWDSGIIDGEQFSYTEYADWINRASAEQVKSWQADPIEVWLGEAITLRSQIYDLPENKRLSYDYVFKNLETVNERMLKAGVRLAGILNEIYG